jgi:DNA (cytosine-5)-methyltransferase 1
VAGSKRDKVRLYGNAVTTTAPELIISALVEPVVGEQFDYALAARPT